MSTFNWAFIRVITSSCHRKYSLCSSCSCQLSATPSTTSITAAAIYYNIHSLYRISATAYFSLLLFLQLTASYHSLPLLLKTAVSHYPHHLPVTIIYYLSHWQPLPLSILGMGNYHLNRNLPLPSPSTYHYDCCYYRRCQLLSTTTLPTPCICQALHPPTKNYHPIPYSSMTKSRLHHLPLLSTTTTALHQPTTASTFLLQYHPRSSTHTHIPFPFPQLVTYHHHHITTS